MLQVKHILISDCIAAMQFCLECDKGYHKAAFQIAKALVAQGRKEEAVQQLQGLFSKPRHVFCINIWKIIGGPEVKASAELICHVLCNFVIAHLQRLTVANAFCMCSPQYTRSCLHSCPCRSRPLLPVTGHALQPTMQHDDLQICNFIICDTNADAEIQ